MSVLGFIALAVAVLSFVLAFMALRMMSTSRRHIERCDAMLERLRGK